MIEALEQIRTEIQSRKNRSAWDKGVEEYAEELLDSIEERATYEHKEPQNATELKKWALNGASDWRAYSYGGCSLIYDRDIAKRLCNPTELKRTRNGARRPNNRETWLNVQARALTQAFARIQIAYEKLTM